MAYKSTFITALLISLIAFGIWTALLSYRSPTLSMNLMASLPDGSMEDVYAVIMDKQGKPKMKIATPRMVHYAEEDTTRLIAPNLTIYRQSPQPWYVTAKHAKATHGVDNVDLWQNVVVHHPGDGKQPATLIKTETLTVNTNKETAETKDLITMIQPNFIIKGIGMFADMNTGDINLFSDVRGEYVPT